ncbi:hypothetical protein [Planctomicrobium piriforme]|uniref:Uncharacterized protein n=1 Tax=Planctomicrobium piriforme TaxID=1576369 RepID=A0A1I3NRJ1_9PLAN|nr:hypothetical protein [Planctomicrobium piriforme]SFJ11802.1 hypothetical protein SAMN05421753_115176 [Planctomicrobium piriforme]
MSDHHDHSHGHSHQHAHDHGHDHGHGHHSAPAQPRGPHKMFVAAVFLMLLGMLVYMLSFDESLQPAGGPAQEMPADAAL